LDYPDPKDHQEPQELQVKREMQERMAHQDHQELPEVLQRPSSRSTDPLDLQDLPDQLVHLEKQDT